ncbi:voltage-gated potassium channel regulatory subunit KCNG2-like isoform 1-T2 [Menidia menidia]
MPIISNTNQDFSSLSVSTDDSSLDRFFTEIPETETPKGVYYQRLRGLAGGATGSGSNEGAGPLGAEPAADPTLQVNVGGCRYALPWSTLERLPLSRLARLRGCPSPEEVGALCDDYDAARREFFFDRSPAAFGAVLQLLAAGRLRLLRQLCAVALHEELDYWGVEPGLMERCCRRRMLVAVEAAAERRHREQRWRRWREGQRMSAGRPAAGVRGLGARLREAMENPHSGLAGKTFACLSVAMVMVTVVSLCISTMPDLREEETRGECSQKCQNMFVVESVCVGWFTLEFLLRFLNAQSKLAFVRGPLNLIDAVAILPYYVGLAVDLRQPPAAVAAAGGRGYLDRLGLVLRLLRALRILYVMRLARHSLGLQTLGLTVRRSSRQLGLLLLFLLVAVALYSPLAHLAESELAPLAAARPHQRFSSIPASYWWAVISMTTVGYGDMVPRSVPGQVVALCIILSGILIMAFPATSIFHTFSRSYQELRQQYRRVWQQEEAEEKAIRDKDQQASHKTHQPIFSATTV